MPEGAGKYDDLCVGVLQKANADCAIVIVVNGNYGSGFSVNTIDESFIFKLPELLEHMASMIRDDISRLRKN